MKFNMRFDDSDMNFPLKMEGNQKQLDVGFQEAQFIHGKDGLDGVSPVVEMTETEVGVDITVTDAEGVKRATVRNGQDGYTPEKGKDYFDGQDGFSPVVAVQDITGGHRVTITDKDGAKAFDVMDGKDGKDGEGGTGGGSPAIIDVVELPKTDIDEDNFYRRLSGQFYYNGTPQGTMTCYIVEMLPQEGVPVTTDMVHITLYYAVDTGAVSGYLPSALGSQIGVPAGWYPVEVLAQAFEVAWGGIITDVSQDPHDNQTRLLLKYDVYHHAQGWVNLSDKVGWRSEAAGAEVFNSLTNKATGVTSHAEGFWTTASGECSHAEGRDTYARGRCQHAEGEYNSADIVSDPSYRGKYIHIAGNGTHDGDRSNAYTLDWSGNGWYQGNVYIGGSGQDDENAVRLLSENDIQSIIQQTIAALPVYGGEVE